MKILRLTVFIVLLLSVTAAFAFIRALNDTASAPYLDSHAASAVSGDDKGSSEFADASPSLKPGELPGVSSGDGDDAPISGNVPSDVGSEAPGRPSETGNATGSAGGNGAGSSESSGASGNAGNSSENNTQNNGESNATNSASSNAAGNSANNGNSAETHETTATGTAPSPTSTSGASSGAAAGTVPSRKDLYETIQIDDFFIHKGSLLLINHNNRFEMPAYPDYVLISSFKTSSYRISDTKMELSYSIMEPLNNMMDAFFAETGLGGVTIISAYRDFDRQQSILNDYITRYGRAEALKWAAQPGYSEHHSGMAFDLGVYSGGSIKTFSGTGAYAWFKQNAYKFGFILRYPPDKTDITKTASEPWHFRYVGDVHAYAISENGWCLEEYIEFLMEHTPTDSYKVIYDSDIYEIFYTNENEFELHKGCVYTISGNNSDGFIVTISWPLDVYKNAIANGTIEPFA